MATMEISVFICLCYPGILMYLCVLMLLNAFILVYKIELKDTFAVLETIDFADTITDMGLQPCSYHAYDPYTRAPKIDLH